MLLKVLGSSSSGNCYIIENDNEAIIIECGIKFSEIKKGLDWNLGKVKCCLVSHEHRDHALAVPELLKAGVMVMTNRDVLASWHLQESYFAKVVISGKGYKVGGFKIVPLGVAHDVPCLAFIIEHKELGRVLFATDTMMLEYKVSRVNHYMIEANYSDEILEENILSGVQPPGMKSRLLQSHMELGTTKEILREADLSQTYNVILLHLSSRNADERLFRSEVEQLVKIPTIVAKKGLKIDLCDNPY